MVITYSKNNNTHAHQQIVTAVQGYSHCVAGQRLPKTMREQIQATQHVVLIKNGSYEGYACNQQCLYRMGAMAHSQHKE